MTPEQRLEALRAFAAQKPDDPFAGYAVAMQLRSLGRAEEALAAFQATAERAPDYVPTWLMMGQVLEGLGRPAEAAQAYRDGIAAATRKQDHHARGELEQALERLTPGEP